MIPVYLITGFLGSGKTTLLREIYNKNSARRLLYLVNEFSMHDVDSRVLGINKEQVISVPGGSIFCTCKVTEFTSKLRMVEESHRTGNNPIEGLVVEASGVADPTVVKKLLSESKLETSFHIDQIICVVDPVTLPALLQTLPNIKKQIKAAGLIIINKTDLAGPETLESVREHIGEINRIAHVLETRYCALAGNPLQEAARGNDFDSDKPAHEPQSDFLKFSLGTRRRVSVDKIKELLKDFSEDIYRLKGFLTDKNGCSFYIDYSISGGLQLKKSADSGLPHLEFIFKPRHAESIRKRIKNLSQE